MSCFAADPTHTGESAIGWLFCKAAARSVEGLDVEVIAVMNVQSVEEFEKAVEREGLSGRLSAVGVAVPAIFKRIPGGEFSRIAYLWWAGASRAVLREISLRHRILYAHHVTYASEILPPPISVLPSTVFKVWGPVGAGGNLRVYAVGPDAPGRRQEYFLQSLRELASRTVGRRLARAMNLVVITNPTTAGNLKVGSGRRVIFPNTILEDSQYRIARAYQSRNRKVLDEPVKIISVGRLIPLKRFELAVAALATDALRSAQLTIVGTPEGDKANELESLAERLGVTDRVHFVGKVSRERAIRLIGEADVLFHPAAREGSSGVVGEASAVGTPVVCFAGTGAAGVLEISGSSGLVLTPRKRMPMDEIAAAIVKASSLPRVPYGGWTEARFVDFAQELLRRTDNAAEER